MFTDAEMRQHLKRTRTEQGLPSRIEDPAALARVAEIIAAAVPIEVRASLDRADVSTSAERARAGRRSGTTTDRERRRKRKRAQPKSTPNKKPKKKRAE